MILSVNYFFFFCTCEHYKTSIHHKYLKHSWSANQKENPTRLVACLVAERVVHFLLTSICIFLTPPPQLGCSSWSVFARKINFEFRFVSTWPVTISKVKAHWAQLFTYNLRNKSFIHTFPKRITLWVSLVIWNHINTFNQKTELSFACPSKSWHAVKSTDQ